MAEYSFSTKTSSTKSYSKTITPSDVQSQAKIPANSTIKSVKLQVKVQKNSTLATGNISITVNGTSVLNESKVINSTGWYTKEIDITNYVNTTGANSGLLKGNIVVKLTSSLNATFTIDYIKVVYDYTEPVVYTVTLDPKGGTVSPTTLTFNEGETYGTLPTPTRDGHVFRYWALENGTRIYSTSKVTSSHTLIALWTALYTITAKANNDSYGTVSGGGTYEDGSTITLTATPKSGYKFLRWDDYITTNPRDVLVSSDKTYTAIFVKEKCTVTVKVSPAEGGTVTGGGTYNYGETVVLTATPNDNYEFVEWSDGNTSVSRGFNVEDDVEYTAYFKIKEFEITIQAGEGGTVIGATSGVYAIGTELNFKALPNKGYVFKQWDVWHGIYNLTFKDETNPITIIVDDNRIYTAVFEKSTQVYSGDSLAPPYSGNTKIAVYVGNTKI